MNYLLEDVGATPVAVMGSVDEVPLELGTGVTECDCPEDDSAAIKGDFEQIILVKQVSQLYVQYSFAKQ